MAFPLCHSPTCRVKIDEQGTGIDLIQLYAYPVFQGCRESEIKFDGVGVAPVSAISSHSRFCSPGYFLSKVPPHKVSERVNHGDTLSMLMN